MPHTTYSRALELYVRYSEPSANRTRLLLELPKNKSSMFRVGIIGGDELSLAAKDNVSNYTKCLIEGGALVIAGGSTDVGSRVLWGSHIIAHSRKTPCASVMLLPYGLQFKTPWQKLYQIHFGHGGLIFAPRNDNQLSTWKIFYQNMVKLCDILLLVESTDNDDCLLALDIAEAANVPVYAVEDDFNTNAKNNQLIKDGRVLRCEHPEQLLYLALSKKAII